jgi:hypothetical protein
MSEPEVYANTYLILTRAPTQQDPHSDIVLVHDDDLARFNEISPISVSEQVHVGFVLLFMFLVPRNPPAAWIFGSPSRSSAQDTAGHIW